MPIANDFAHLTRVDLTIKFGGHPMFDPDVVFGVWMPNLSEAGWDEAQVLATLQAVADAADAPHPYDLHVNKGHFSWGADGGTYLDALVYLMQTAASGAIGNAAWSALVAAVRRVGPDEPDHPLDERAAIHAATMRIVKAYAHLSSDDLQVTSTEELEAGAWNVACLAPKGERFEVWVGPSGRSAMTRVKHFPPLPDADDPTAEHPADSTRHQGR